MKRFFTILLLLAFVSFGFAQLTGDGYYRVTNDKSKYYSWMVDCTGGINGADPQMYAIQLWPSSKRDPMCEAQTIIYVSSHGNNTYDLEAQGTGLHDIIGYYVTIQGSATANKYNVSASVGGVTTYLYETTADTYYGYREMTIQESSTTERLWNALPVSSSSDTNYFGIKPTITANRKHYAPFYAAFPFKFASSGMKAYYVSKFDGEVAVIKPVETEIIPSNTPLLIECSSTETKNNKLDLLRGNYNAVGGNVLKGVMFSTEFVSLQKSPTCRTEFNPLTMRVWNSKDGKLVLSTNTDLLHRGVTSYANGLYLNANSSYLPVPAGTPDEVVIMTEAEYATYIANKPVNVSSISVTAAATTIVRGTTTTVTATVLPENATNNAITWSSNNTAVATVSADGVVTGVAAGTATITAKATDGSNVTGSVTITVVKPTYTITFLDDNGNVISQNTYEEGTTVTPPAAPAKTGYSFAGWTPAFNATATADATYQATYSINHHDVIYMVDGTEYQRVNYVYGATVTVVPNPVKEGYTFSGWQGVPTVMPDNDVTVTGTFTPNNYTLTYMVDGELYHSEVYACDAQITPIAEPVKEGKTFSGWQGLPEVMPAHDVTVVGSFDANIYTIFYIVDGKSYRTAQCAYGDTVVVIEDPVKDGYTFSGWQNVPEVMPSHNIEITGTFSINSYTITYLLDGEVYGTQTYNFDEKVTALAAPESRTGYTFSGWQNLPAKMPANDVTVTGAFNVNYYSLTFVAGGATVAKYDVAYGDTIVAPEGPEREGYSFYWKDLPETMPAKPLIIYGSYSVNTYDVIYIIAEDTVHVDHVVYNRSIPTFRYNPQPGQPEISGWECDYEGTFTSMPAHNLTYRGIIIDGIVGVTVDDRQNARYFTLDGKALAAPRRGEINLMRTSDGRLHKVFVK